MSRSLPGGLLWGICAAVLLVSTRDAAAQSEPVKPYIVLIADTSGSMADPVTSGPPSCAGAAANRMDHAKCAIQNITNSYDEMVLALARFRISTSDGDCTNGCTGSYFCDGDEPDSFELVVPLDEDNASELLNWVDYSLTLCDGNNDCTVRSTTEPELFAFGNTPLAGSLRGAQRYWQGNDPDYPSEDPIRSDPLNDVFVNGEQCRPYITILLTDGAETCASFNPETTDAAAALLTTDVDGTTYRIETKPIGFGISPGDAEIEAMAHAGGEPDVIGVHEGAYAQNEEELQLEISQIIADSIKFESCNALDDDCDILIDEDFPEKGQVCDDGEDGICRGTGIYVCNLEGTGTECQIIDPGQTPTGETCDGEDEDCDGSIDEGGVCQGCTGVELCNSLDDDCDGAFDEDLTRPCGTDLGVCTAGTETCVDGAWEGCTATGGGGETCNGLDDDCDGTVDGFAEECVTLPDNNPGVGVCEPGTRVCPADGSGEWGPCIGETGPSVEGCDTLDNDCDGDVDEDTGGEDCSSACGVGVTVCVDGVLECSSTIAEDDDTCNNLDDDCDGAIDENAAPGGTCDAGGTICNGNLICMNGGYVCVGESIEPELCNCENDDCDTQVDEGDICPTDSECVDPSTDGYACQCAQACAAGEFPCPIGRICVDGFCLVDPCAGVTCDPLPNGDLTVCEVGECVRVCDDVTCPAGYVCYGPTGECAPDDCTTFPDYCTVDQVCIAGECVSDPCAGVDCTDGEYCYGGECYGSCSGVECPAGERCRLGECEADPCGMTCPDGQVCDESAGQCVDNACPPNRTCPTGERCDPLSGECEPDPCAGVECPAEDEVCREGTCYGPEQLVDAGSGPDADPDVITTGGGGGCDAGGGGGGGWIIVVMMLALGRARARARARVGALVVVALFAGCDRNDYCIDCPSGGGDGGGDEHDGGIDGDPGDGGTMPDACIPTGAEVCNQLDDDCDGSVDEEAAQVGDACGTDVGACTAGVIECAAGELRCTGTPAMPEACNDADDDCDGDVDEGNPEGGAMCGSDVGECQAGVTTCVGGVLDCVGDVGTPGQDPEICDGKDNDCDNLFDEGIATQGACGFPDEGQCEPGELTCVGGQMQCVGGTGPTFELCDAIDQDCDGSATNGYDLMGDVRNCGSCGNSCIGTITNATEKCELGECVIAGCDPGFFDDPDVAGDDCLYACDFQGPVEACNDADDDCDGVVDENVGSPPDICDHDGACAGTVATCTPSGWDCVYTGDVSVDTMGNIGPETECDGVDNDCDNDVDESHPNRGAACLGSGEGVCQDRGVLACDTTDEDGPLVCDITTQGGTASAEICDNLDNDCNGVVDDGALTGALQAWVSIGGDTEIMKYEASRPDARSTTVGTVTTHVCSRADVLPWTGLTQPQAEAECAAIGARLCTEQEWHRACSLTVGTTYPMTEPSTNNGFMFFEAEDYYALATATSGSVVRTWVPDSTAGYSGISAMRASPNTGALVSQANAPSQAPRLDFLVNFTQTGNHYVWVRGYGPSGNDDSVWVGISTTPGTSQPQRQVNPSTSWGWTRSDSINVTATGNQYVSVYMREDGTKVDAIVVTRASSGTPTFSTDNGNHWSYATNPDTYQATTCNGADRDPNSDAIVATGSLASCNSAWPLANGGGVFDLSGNVKEWTSERLPGANPIRGGASNNTAQGISCALNFTLADDAFFFNNVGFRCCR